MKKKAFKLRSHSVANWRWSWFLIILQNDDGDVFAESTTTLGLTNRTPDGNPEVHTTWRRRVRILFFKCNIKDFSSLSIFGGKMGRCRLETYFSILPIWTDFLSIKMLGNTDFFEKPWILFDPLWYWSRKIGEK